MTTPTPMHPLDFAEQKTPYFPPGTSAAEARSINAAIDEAQVAGPAGRDALNSEAQAALRKEFGSGRDYDLALQAAREQVAQHPKLAAMLDRSGAGNVPALVVRLARQGISKKAAEARKFLGMADERTIAQRMYPGMNP